MVDTRSRSAEPQQEQQQHQHQHQKQQLRPERAKTTTMTASDHRGLRQVFGDVTYATRPTYNGVPPDHVKAIADITRFPRTTVQADDENDFE